MTMKTLPKFLSGLIGILCLVALFLLPKESEARGAMKYNPCICYTYYSDGTIMESESCDAPSPTGACPKIVHCVPPLPNDDQ